MKSQSTLILRLAGITITAISISFTACGQGKNTKSSQPAAQAAPAGDTTTPPPAAKANDQSPQKPPADGSKTVTNTKPATLELITIKSKYPQQVSLCEKSKWLQKLMMTQLKRATCDDFTSDDLLSVIGINQPEIADDSEKHLEIGDFIDFKHLMRLDLSGQKLTGAIPADIEKLTQLNILDLGGNCLTGTLPKELWKLTSLKTLFLNQTCLTGVVSTEISHLTNLENLDLSMNQFSGEILTSMISLINLRILKIENNLFTGEIPKELDQLSHLIAITLVGNKFTGSLPDKINKTIYNHVGPSH